jgi:hypothetical protein
MVIGGVYKYSSSDYQISPVNLTVPLDFLYLGKMDKITLISNSA